MRTMNKNIVKIIIKTSISVVIIGVSLIVIFATILGSKDEDEDGWTTDDSIKYDYENGNYDFIMSSLTHYDTSDDKY